MKLGFKDDSEVGSTKTLRPRFELCESTVITALELKLKVKGDLLVTDDSDNQTELVEIVEPSISARERQEKDNSRPNATAYIDPVTGN